jgi:hypothetical protein
MIMIERLRPQNLHDHRSFDCVTFFVAHRDDCKRMKALCRKKFVDECQNVIAIANALRHSQFCSLPTAAIVSASLGALTPTLKRIKTPLSRRFGECTKGKDDRSLVETVRCDLARLQGTRPTAGADLCVEASERKAGLASTGNDW